MAHMGVYRAMQGYIGLGMLRNHCITTSGRVNNLCCSLVYNNYRKKDPPQYEIFPLSYAVMLGVWNIPKVGDATTGGR